MQLNEKLPAWCSAVGIALLALIVVLLIVIIYRI